MNILFISLIPPPIAYELIRQLQTNLIQKRSDRYRLPRERNNTACSPEAMAPEMPEWAGQQQMGSQEVHAVTRQTPASTGAALGRAPACLAGWGEAAKAVRSCSRDRGVTGECGCQGQLLELRQRIVHYAACQ